MRKGFNIYSNILLLILSSFLTIFHSNKVLSKDNQNQISTEYLTNLPARDYIVGPGDQLKIVISRDYPELTSLSLVDSEGTIYIPRLNRIFVEGLTLNELNQVLNKALEDYIKFPEVEVSVMKYKPVKVFIDGEVENPGLVTLEGAFSSEVKKEISIRPNLNGQQSTVYFFPTVFDAIRQSGGITDLSDLSNIQVIRKNSLSSGGGRITTTLNFEKVMLYGDLSQNIRIYDSDIILVKKSNIPNTKILQKAILSNLNPKFVNVSVVGRVNNPGNITISKASVLNDAIDLAGGTKLFKGPLTFIRFNNNGTIDKRIINYKRSNRRNSYKNPLLKEGDVIFVGDSILSASTEVINEITAPFTGIFSTYGLYKALNN